MFGLYRSFLFSEMPLSMAMHTHALFAKKHLNASKSTFHSWLMTLAQREKLVDYYAKNEVYSNIYVKLAFRRLLVLIAVCTGMKRAE